MLNLIRTQFTEICATRMQHNGEEELPISMFDLKACLSFEFILQLECLLVVFFNFFLT